MFDWLEDLLRALGDMFGDAYQQIGEAVSKAIWDTMLKWFYEIVYTALAAFFDMINGFGAEIFELGWVQAAIALFVKFGWGLYVVGVVVAVFDVAVEYQHGRANIRSCSINILKGFFACSLIGTVPVELYKFCITLQYTFSKNLVDAYVLSNRVDFPKLVADVFNKIFDLETGHQGFIDLVFLLAFAYCVIKLFFQNLKRGGILMIQIAVGTLYMFSVPRGYTDGFNQWMKQVIAICLTAFLQTTLFYLGLLTMSDQLILGLGIMFAANEVPRIAQQFGLDSSVKVNMMSVVHTATTTASLVRAVGKAVK
jgi:hypothetical protein